MGKRRPKQRNVQDRLDAVYAKVPNPGCKGLCHDACGSVAMTSLEHLRIVARHGVNLPLVAAPAVNGDPVTALGLRGDRCRALTGDHQCSIYPDRPLICRLYGAADPLPCPYGCVPEKGRMSHRDARLALAAVEELAGNLGRAAALGTGGAE